MLSLRSLRLWVKNGYWTWVMYQVGPCNCMMMGKLYDDDGYQQKALGYPRLGGLPRKLAKKVECGSRVLEAVGWVARRRSRAVYELEVRQLEGAKEIDPSPVVGQDRLALPGKIEREELP